MPTLMFLTGEYWGQTTVFQLPRVVRAHAKGTFRNHQLACRR